MDHIYVHGPFKFAYNKAVKDWVINNPATKMTIYVVRGLITKAFPKAFTQINNSPRFKKTGKYSFGENCFDDSDLLSSTLLVIPSNKLASQI